MSTSAPDSMFHRMTLATQLTLVSGGLAVILIGVGITSWLLMQVLSNHADRVNQTNVPQLALIAQIELNVTRASLQLRHAILARTPQERQIALDDITAKVTGLNASIAQYGNGAIDAQGREAFAPIPALMQDFSKLGATNAALIVAGRKDDAFAFLVDETIPARNRLLKVLDAEKQRQSELMRSAIADIQSMSQINRAVIVSAVALAALALLWLVWYLSRVTRQLGADPHVLKAVADTVAAGNLSTPIATRKGDDSSVLHALALMRDQLGQTVSTVRAGAESVAMASSEIAQGNSDLSARTESQASALEQSAAAMEQLSSTVRQNADNAQLANQLAAGASTVAQQGGQAVNEVVATMKGIQDSSKKIADIITVIDAIAFQTNILALNAAVEAARAGEQGRGFAVVASEVRTLASRSAEAAKEIKHLITDSVERVGQGTASADKAGETMQQVVASIQRVTDIVAEISAASSEQSQGVNQMGEAITQMDHATQQNAALVEEMAAAASSLNAQAGDLLKAVAVFKTSKEQSTQRITAPA